MLVAVGLALAAPANADPPVVDRIAAQRAQEGTRFRFTIPRAAFSDPDDNFRDLTITVRELADVGWLNITGRRLRGTAQALDQPTRVRVTVEDPAGERDTTIFRVRITPRSRDDETGQSTASPDENGNSDSTDPSISADGRFVAHVFENPTNPPQQSIVLRDFTFPRFSGRGRFTVAGPIGFELNSGAVLFSNPSISADGSVMAFVGLRRPPQANTVAVQVVRVTDTDPLRKTTEFVQDILDVADPDDRNLLVDSTDVSLSADGRIVAFEECTATIDECRGAVERGTNVVVAKIGAGGAPLVIENASGPSLSRTGHRLAYERLTSSGAQEVVLATLNDSRTGVVRTTVIGLGSNPVVSPDGNFVAFERGAIGARDIFVYNRSRRTTALVSVDADGERAEGELFQPFAFGGRKPRGVRTWQFYRFLVFFRDGMPANPRAESRPPGRAARRVAHRQRR